MSEEITRREIIFGIFTLLGYGCAKKIAEPLQKLNNLPGGYLADNQTRNELEVLALTKNLESENYIRNKREIQNASIQHSQGQEPDVERLIEICRQVDQDGDKRITVDEITDFYSKTINGTNLSKRNGP